MKFIRNLIHWIGTLVSSLDPQDPRTNDQSASHGDTDAERQQVAAAINSLSEHLKTSEKERNEHDRQMRAIDSRRLGIEKVVMWTVILGTLGALLTLFFLKLSSDAATAAATAATQQVDVTREG